MATDRPHYPKGLQELEPNALYIVLYLRSLAQQNDFHWAFYLHADERTGGAKLHIRNPANAHLWLTDHGQTRGILKEMGLIGLLQIQILPAAAVEKARTLILQDDECLNDIEGTTCRTWLGRACDRLHSQEFLDESWDSVQQQAFAFGNANLETAVTATLPRPVGSMHA